MRGASDGAISYSALRTAGLCRATLPTDSYIVLMLRAYGEADFPEAVLLAVSCVQCSAPALQSLISTCWGPLYDIFGSLLPGCLFSTDGLMQSMKASIRSTMATLLCGYSSSPQLFACLGL